jgi:predicted NUDIX family NTP pyrophosphohydrolase
MADIAAGILLFRGRALEAEVFLVHPGGPFWAGKDLGSWSVPKGILEPGEDEIAGALREFREETGLALSVDFSPRDLGTFRISASKTLHVWAVEGDADPMKLSSNSFELEWPPGSGHIREFPEVDRGGWFGHAQAIRRITKGQRPVIEHFYRVICQ